MALALFAGIPVRSFVDAVPWYERLLGPRTFDAHATESVWKLGDGRHVFVVEDAGRAGHALVTVFLEDADLDAHVVQIEARGCAPDRRESYGNGVRKVTFRDPDGNEIAFGGPPA